MFYDVKSNIHKPAPPTFYSLGFSLALTQFLLTLSIYHTEPAHKHGLVFSGASCIALLTNLANCLISRLSNYYVKREDENFYLGYNILIGVDDKWIG